jgi:hypothetical protein
MAYAYGTKTGTIHVVSVADGTNRSIAVTTPKDTSPGIVVEEFDGRNAYFSLGSITGRPAGMWRIDVTSGSITPLAQVTDVFAVRDGSAWIGYLDPHDTNPPRLPPQGEGALYDTIVRVNLTTGARTTWFYRPGQSVVLRDVDSSGRPIVLVNPGPDYLAAGGELRRLGEPLSGGEDNGELVYSGPIGFEQPQPDGDRIWLGNDRGVYLYTPAAGLQKVYGFSGSGQTMFPAGLCA